MTKESVVSENFLLDEPIERVAREVESQARALARELLGAVPAVLGLELGIPRARGDDPLPAGAGRLSASGHPAVRMARALHHCASVHPLHFVANDIVRPSFSYRQRKCLTGIS